MIKIINKKYIKFEDQGLQEQMLASYANRKYALVNTNPIYYGKKGIAVAGPGHELNFLFEELRLHLKYFKMRKELD